MEFQHIVLNRADKIGDVLVALPMAAILKRIFNGCKVSLLAQRYTLPLARCCEHLDEIYVWDDIRAAPRSERVKRFKAFDADAIVHVYPMAAIANLARQAKIPLRVGTSRRLFHWLTCNELVRVSRRYSPLHEAQLNIQLLRGVGVDGSFHLEEISRLFGLTRIDPLPANLAACIDRSRFNLIVHPKSAGSAREWPVAHFARLIETVPRNRFNILVTGSEAEGQLVRGALPMHLPHVVDLTGKLSLGELISLIHAADGLLAASTGPLHIAAALGKHALGLYVPFRSKHAGRWGPIGPHARVFQRASRCGSCPDPTDCECMRQISPAEIRSCLLELASARPSVEESLPKSSAASARA